VNMVIDMNEESKVVVDSDSCEHLLSSRKVQQYLRNERDLVILSSNSPVSTALKTLIDNGIHSAPVFDAEANTYLGFLDLLDVVSWVVCTFSTPGEQQILEEDLFTSLKNEQKWFTTPVKEVIGRNLFKPVGKDATLLDVARIMGSSVHSIPVVDFKTNSFLGIITQSQIIQILCEHIEQLGEVGKQTLEELGLATHVVLFAKRTDIALEAFKSLHEWKVHGIPIVSDSESKVLVGNLSASDMRVVVPDKFQFSCLYLPLHELIKRIRKAFAVHISPAVFCLKTDTLANVIRILAANNLHRIYVVDTHMKLSAVVSLCDILRVLYTNL